MGRKEKNDPFHVAALFSGQGAEKLFYHLMLGGLAALLSSAELLFGVCPFGVALAAAAMGPYVVAVALGSALFSLAARDAATLVALGTVLLVRAAVSWLLAGELSPKALFAERALYRIPAAAVAVLGVGIAEVIGGGFRFFDLFGMLLAVAAAPLAAFLYFGVFEKGRGLMAYHREAGMSAVVLSAVFALRTVNVFGIYPAAAAAAGVAFLLVSHRGTLSGAVGGALCGLCFDVRLAPAFLLVGLAFGLLQKSSRGGGVLLGSTLAGVWTFLIEREAGLLRLLPSLLVAGAIFLAFDSAGLVEGAPVRRLMLARKRAATQSAKAEAQAVSTTRLAEMSNALLDLSGTFYEIGSRLRRPGLPAIRRMCDKAFESVCPGCRYRDVCFGERRGETSGAIEGICRRLYRHGSVERSQVSEELATRCTEIARILTVINNGAAALAEEALHSDKTSVVAMDYAAVGRVIKETIEEGREDFCCDIAAGERIFTSLLRLGYGLESVAVCGKTRRRVILRGLRATGRSIRLREIRGVIEKHAHVTLGTPDVREHEGLSDIVFFEHGKLTARSVKMTRPKGRGEGRHCGDSVSAFEGEQGLSYAFICDGMGSGTDAALTSALASVFLNRLLGAGSRAESALRMLNGFLAARAQGESESSTTVDLLEVDRIGGTAALFKCGAAPTYLLRRGEVTRFSSRTAPVGILEALDAERIVFSLEPGDVVVQLSDGFTGGEEDCPWLTEMLATRYDGDADAFARLAINRASAEESDDLSIIVTEIGQAPLPWEEERTTSA
ncbi:MAG: SpoIIE family protein phosphatase [Clostridia bacterium]|nr:SpoIIE family protein phosphatase [Clostridia bacterium]